MPLFTLRINGRTHRVEGEPDDSLLSVLRHDLGADGQQIRVRRRPLRRLHRARRRQTTRSCVTGISRVAGKAITTIEGLAEGDRCIRFSRRFSRPKRFSAATARPAWSWRQSVCCERMPNPTEDDIAACSTGTSAGAGHIPRIVRAVQPGGGAHARAPAAGAGDETSPDDRHRARALRAVTEPRRYRVRARRRDFLRLLAAGLVVCVAMPAASPLRNRAGRAGVAARSAASSRRGCTSTSAAASRPTPAKSRSVRTSARRWRRRSPTSCGCRSTSVTLVMADTDLTPFDAGTFGSRTTPGMAPQLARAAATAREMLIDRAAAQWQVDRATLTADDGRIDRARRRVRSRTAS